MPHHEGSTVQPAEQRAGHLAHDAKSQVAEVSDEAKVRARSLTDTARDEVGTRVAEQQQRLAGLLRTAGDELTAMADRRASTSADSPGGYHLAGSPDGDPAQENALSMTTDTVRRIAQAAQRSGDWLESRDPRDLMLETRRFARRRPGIFLAVAVVAGAVAGRLTRNLGQANGRHADTAVDIDDHDRESDHESDAAPGQNPIRDPRGTVGYQL